jgi:hypothetical protein
MERPRRIEIDEFRSLPLVARAAPTWEERVATAWAVVREDARRKRAGAGGMVTPEPVECSLGAGIAGTRAHRSVARGLQRFMTPGGRRDGT